MWIIAIGIALPALAVAAVIRAWLVHRIRAAERSAMRRPRPTRNTRGRALVVYRDGFTDVTWDVARAASRGLTASGYDVTLTIARPQVAPTARETDLLVVIAPTYFNRLARSVERMVGALRPLPCTRTVAITAGTSDAHARNRLCAILRGAGAAVVASQAFVTGAPEQSVTNWVATVVRPHPDPAPRRARTSTVERLRLVPASPPSCDMESRLEPC